MTTLTERYAAAVLRGIPERQRADVDRELTSSIADAVEDRVAGGEARAAAERDVIEGLGEPSRLAASYSGRPLHLIGPELFPVYRHVLVMLLSISLPIVALVLAGVTIAGGGGYADALLAGFGGALSVGVHICFWVTVTFAAFERFEVMREARTEIVDATGRWTVDMLPDEPADRDSLGDTLGEVFATLLAIGGILFLRDTSWFSGADGAGTAILDPALSTFWLPLLIAILVAQAALQVVVHLVGRWTMPLAAGSALLHLAWALPVIALALSGQIVNPAFAANVGWTDLRSGNAPAMLLVAAGTTLVTAWEIFDVFRRARRTSRRAGNGWKEQAA
jgi:hypothetical protein